MKKKIWLSIIIIGLSGQIAWTVENMYFNIFLYNTISQNPQYIATMVALSAIVATITTLFMGTLSDRIGKRKPFIVWGYLLWALSVALFGFISPSTFKSAKGAAIAVVVLDCVMTFFGSTSNDAVFNAYVTEKIEAKRRTKIESVLQIMPMIAMLFVFGVMDGFTQKGEWRTFFLIVATIMGVAGVLSFFLIDNKESEKINNSSFLSSLSFGFRTSTIKGNKKLYLSLVAFGLNALGMQVFFPYLIIYVQNFLGFNNYVILLGIVLIVSSILCVILGRLIDQMGRVNWALPSLLVMVVGMTMMFFSRSFVLTTISGTIMMSGYLLSTSVLSSLVRDYTPKGREGEIQGVRMIFTVMLPMVIGPYLGAIAIMNSKLTYVEFGEIKSVPTPIIFLIAAIVTILGIIPIIMLKKQEKRI